MEACCGAHHLGRILVLQGHDVRLIPPQYVKPLVHGRRGNHDTAGEYPQRSPRLRYLGRYTPRVAISNHRLLAFDGDHLTFSYKDSAGGNQRRTREGWTVRLHRRRAKPSPGSRLPLTRSLPEPRPYRECRELAPKMQNVRRDSSAFLQVPLPLSVHAAPGGTGDATLPIAASEPQRLTVPLVISLAPLLTG
jgi:hypothetical protein